MKYNEIEDICINQMDVDYMPLHDVVREFTTNNKRPTRDEFELALDFLQKFLENNAVKVLYGKEMNYRGGDNSIEIIQWLKELWNKEDYDDFNYAVWFDKA